MSSTKSAIKRHKSRGSERAVDPSERRKQSSKKSNMESTVTSRSTMTSNSRTEKAGEVFSPEAKEAMRNFVHDVTHKGLHELRVQYNDMKGFKPADSAHTSSDANRGKCRYDDIPCWDATRVVLKWPPGTTEDFIHANWVKHELLGKNQFLCCQGPKKGTEGDFWRMCWQEGVRQIIMLCRCVELSKPKCSQYWPKEPGQEVEYAGLKIKCEKIDDKSDKSFVHTKLSVTYEDETRLVDHRQWMTWPDKSVPKTPLAPFRLLQYARKSHKHPSVIHCSAGVGRTGTLVAIELIYKSLLKGGAPSPPALVRDIRAQRSHAVQTEDQYVYIHYAMLQMLLAKKVVSEEDIRQFCKEYESYIRLLNENGGKQLPLNATTPTTTCSHCNNQKSTFTQPEDPEGTQEEESTKRADKKKKKSGEKIADKAIVYQPRTDQPYMKVLATPKGQPAPALVLPPKCAPELNSVDQGENGAFKPAKSYTIEERDGQRKIVYHANRTGIIKTLAAGPGQPQYAQFCPPRGPPSSDAQATQATSPGGRTPTGNHP